MSAANADLCAAIFTLASPSRDLFMEIQFYRLYQVFFGMTLTRSLIVDYSPRIVLK